MLRPVERCAINTKSSWINRQRGWQRDRIGDGAGWRIVAYSALIGAALGLLVTA